MTAILSRVRGRLRLARGRCPACASESAEGCGICLSHQGPFPVEPAQLQRWAFRFDARVGSGAGAATAHLAGPVTRSEAAQSWASI